MAAPCRRSTAPHPAPASLQGPCGGQRSTARRCGRGLGPSPRSWGSRSWTGPAVIPRGRDLTPWAGFPERRPPLGSPGVAGGRCVRVASQPFRPPPPPPAMGPRGIGRQTSQARFMVRSATGTTVGLPGTHQAGTRRKEGTRTHGQASTRPITLPIPPRLVWACPRAWNRTTQQPAPCGRGVGLLRATLRSGQPSERLTGSSVGHSASVWRAPFSRLTAPPHPSRNPLQDNPQFRIRPGRKVGTPNIIPAIMRNAGQPRPRRGRIA